MNDEQAGMDGSRDWSEHVGGLYLRQHDSCLTSVEKDMTAPDENEKIDAMVFRKGTE